MCVDCGSVAALLSNHNLYNSSQCICLLVSRGNGQELRTEVQLGIIKLPSTDKKKKVTPGEENTKKRKKNSGVRQDAGGDGYQWR